MAQAVALAKQSGVSLEEFQQIVTLLYEGESI